jgi:hypothetical protein
MPAESPAQALRIIEDIETGNRFVLYTNKEGTSLEVRFDGEAPWFTQADLAAIYGVTIPTVIGHIQRFRDDGELDDSTTRDFLVVRQEGSRHINRPISHYGLDVAFYVGYRVNSGEGKLFRRWATTMLVQLATKGFVIDQRRLKGDENAERIRELREIIRDIRSQEANLYAELRNICAMCQDYDAHSDDAQRFYQHTQAKLFHATVSHTPARLIVARADANQPNMGLQSWSGDRILQADATTGKNYLAEGELKELNRLTSILLDVFEDQLKLGRLTKMDECSVLLDDQLRGLGRSVLERPGPPRSDVANKHAKAQYKIFDEQRRAALKVQADKELRELKAAAKSLPDERTAKKASKQKRPKSTK